MTREISEPGQEEQQCDHRILQLMREKGLSYDDAENQARGELQEKMQRPEN